MSSDEVAAAERLIELAMRESKALGDENQPRRTKARRPRRRPRPEDQSTAGVIAEASMVPPNLEVVSVTFSPTFMRLMLTPRATL